MMSANTKTLWKPSEADKLQATITRFVKEAESRSGRRLDSYGKLHQWSVEDREAFWNLMWDFSGIVGEKGNSTIHHSDRMPGAQFFPEARINFAENLLCRTGQGDALIFQGEDKVTRRVSWDELRKMVSRIQRYFRDQGIKPGDRIAAMMPNMAETVACMLAAASIGAIWASCSPDFGEQGILDRFGQIEPVLFIGCDGYWYNGKRQDTGNKIASVIEMLPSVRRAVIVDYLGNADQVASTTRNGVSLAEILVSTPAGELEFERLPFSHPLYILFSSGTTGVPKCIMHSAGGTLIQHRKEQLLHCNIGNGDRVFYFTTCSWMMWNWLVSALACGATLLLYDGSPFYPDGNRLFDLADREKITFFGTSAKFIDAVRKAGLEPRQTHELGSVKAIASTGSPLSPEGFRFVYDAVKKDVHLASISGGTDIVGCFVLGVPTLPVRSGEIQAPGLGMAIDVWDDTGQRLESGKGELVCTRAFPSMPIAFWNDPEGVKYHDAYFDRFPGVWCHGDFAEWTESGGMIIHGRSDATLNPGGVRIGTAEIYNQVEQMDEIIEAICIGQEWEDDVRVVLFVRLAEEVTFSEALEKRIKDKIRSGASPRHVPARIIPVADIPRTKSGKIVELAVRDVVHGRSVKNKEVLANPEALHLYADLAELKR